MATLSIFSSFRATAYNQDNRVASRQTYYYVPTSLLTCQQIEALFANLTYTQAMAILALCATSAPATPSGYSVVMRDCTSGSDDIIVIGDNSGDPSMSVTTGSGFDNSYTFTRAAGSDFNGVPFVLTPAPILTAVAQTQFRLTGNNYSFTPQTALNTALFKRLPPFTTHSSKIIIYPGGLYTSDDDNNLIGRGFTHVSESVKFPLDTYPTNLHRAIEMANYQAAYDAAQDPSATDAQKTKLLAWAGPLPAFEGNHLFIDDEATCQLYAKHWYALFSQPDWKGASVDYFSVNHEVYVARDGSAYNYVQQWYRQVGWITKAIIALSAADSARSTPLQSGITDFGNLSATAPYYFDDIDSATGFPNYLSYGTITECYRGGSQAAPLAANTDLGALLLAGKAFTGTGRYMQHTSDGQSLFEKNSDGTLKVVSGNPVWRTDKRDTTLSGQASVIYKDDNLLAMIKRYGFEASDYANYFFRAGSVHLAASNVRGSGYGNVRFSSQFRLDTEVQSGLNPADYGLTTDEFNMLNSRPLYPKWAEGNAIRMYLNSDYIRGWMETQNRTDIGSDNGKPSKARASVELYQKGFHRAAQLNWIFDTTYKPIEPKLWLKQQGIVSTANDDEHFARKPIIRGGIAVKNSRRVIFLRGEWPCQDETRTTVVTAWVNHSGTLSPAYQFQLVGRDTFVDEVQLPAGFTDFDPTDVRIQFHSLLDELITWTGDYRDAKITSNPTPPTLAT